MSYADPHIVTQLRSRIRVLEQGSAPPETLSIGAPDAVLPWGGLPLARLHQVVAADASALGFAAALLALAARGRPILWCRRRNVLDRPFLPGLAAFGLAPEQVLLAEAKSASEVLWTMEEGLRCPSLGAVLGETPQFGLTAARRLQLAAESGGVSGLVVTPEQAGAGGATTRWRVAAAPSMLTPWGGIGPPRWQVALERCRGGLPRAWTLEWRDGGFASDHPLPSLHLPDESGWMANGASFRSGSPISPAIA